MDARACPICGPVPAAELGGFAPFPVRRCGSCGLVYLNGPGQRERFVEAARGNGAEYWSFPHLFDKHRRVFEAFFEERLGRILAAVGRLDSVLDIGCGYGFFAGYLHRRGVRVLGIEPSAECAAHARDAFGVEVVETDFESFTTRDRFDAITACDVLEHVEDPGGFLARCRSMLNGGAVYIQVPNVMGDVLPPGGAFNFPYHLWQFSPATLERLMRVAGLEVVDWWTGVMGVIGVYESGGPSPQTLSMWRLARAERRGNRLQMMARAMENGDADHG